MTRNTHRTHLTVDPELYARLKTKCAKEGQTVSGITRDFWQDYVNGKKWASTDVEHSRLVEEFNRLQQPLLDLFGELPAISGELTEIIKDLGSLLEKQIARNREMIDTLENIISDMKEAPEADK